jgi:hypothetical protein
MRLHLRINDKGSSILTENLIKWSTEHFKNEAVYVCIPHYLNCTENFLDKGIRMHVAGMFHYVFVQIACVYDINI